MTLAFEGIRVLEFSQVISGPMAAAWLGFLGADVIKIETPGEGDQGRRMMDGGALAGKNMSPLYQGLNTGKRSLSLNLKHPRSRELLARVQCVHVLLRARRNAAAHDRSWRQVVPRFGLADQPPG